MIIDRRSANAVGGKTARACDSCIRRRARWYCTADDAFLCQGCDTSVHSANQLASRHERVRLGTFALKDSTGGEDSTTPAWHRGFTKKARTRRNTNKSQLSVQEAKNEEKFFNPLPLVPEIGREETTSPFDHENHDEQVSYQVPVFEPFAAGEGMDYEHGEIDDLERFLLPSDMELAEFAADVESLLGGEIKNDRYEENGGAHFCHDQGGRVKVELDEDEGEIEAVLACQFDPMIDVMRETLDWNFDYESPMTGEEVEEEKVVVESMIMNQERKAEMRRNISLKLNYEEVITSWASQKSPWTDGIRPEFNPDDDCWPDFMGMCPTNFHHHNGEIGGVGGQVGSGDGAREARVSRYREKRRTRLFSKKIRYEVRKLNAEKRPRMRGRFVKRTSFAVAVPTTFPNYLNK